MDEPAYNLNLIQVHSNHYSLLLILRENKCDARSGEYDKSVSCFHNCFS